MGLSPFSSLMLPFRWLSTVWLWPSKWIQMKRARTFPATSHHRARILQLAMFDYRRVYPKIEPHVVKYSIHGACIHMYVYTYVHLYIYIYMSESWTMLQIYSIICWRIPSRCWPYFSSLLGESVLPRCPTPMCSLRPVSVTPWKEKDCLGCGKAPQMVIAGNFGWMTPPKKNMVSERHWVILKSKDLLFCDNIWYMR